MSTSASKRLIWLIDAAFREAGITIPFPQRDLHVISYPDETPPEVAAKSTKISKKDDFTSTRTQSDSITRSHTENIDVRAGLTDVWQAITDIEVLKKWLVQDGEFSPHIGGAFQLSLLDSSDISGRIDIYIPNRRMRLVVALRDGAEPLPTGPITIGLQLKEIENGTTLSVTVAGIPADEDWEEDYKRSEMRWQNGLEELRSVLNDSS